MSKPVQKEKVPFENAKKGEINDLKKLLQSMITEKNEIKKRECVKKVISFMTSNIDVSQLFTDMCMISQTNDLITKKMIYLFLSHYSKEQPDQALMAINTFRKDCDHKNPKIKGLALRNLCSLDFQGSSEYLLPSIQQALEDSDPYVKKIAIIGCLKLYYLNPDYIQDEIIDKLYLLIKDYDQLVVINSILVLDEIFMNDGGIAVSKKMIVHLLNRLTDFNEWGQSIILQLAAKYQPKNEDEMLDILNLLDDRLKNASSSIVLGCIKVFLQYTTNNELLYNQVLERISKPLVTLLTQNESQQNPELAYIILSHILYIAKRTRNAYFEKNFKSFYCKDQQVSYIKKLKLKIITEIASENNLGDILNELKEYISDVDTQLAQNSIIALSEIALKLPDMASAIIKQFLVFVDSNVAYINNQIIIAFSKILRKYPQKHEDITSQIEQIIDSITDPNANIALIQILGEFGEFIGRSPYTLKDFIVNYEQQCNNLQIKHALLSSSIKLFLKRPPEMQKYLGQLFKKILDNENEDVDLKDRAAFYYRIMRQNLNQLAIIINNKEEITTFVEDEQLLSQNSEIEFKTLSTIFEQPESKFIKNITYFKNLKDQENEQRNNQIEQKQKEEEYYMKKSLEAQQQQKENLENNVEVTDLLGDDELNIMDQDQEIQAQSAISFENYDNSINISTQDYQVMWMEIPESYSQEFELKHSNNLEENFIEQQLTNAHLNCIASGQQNDQLKFYFYSKDLQEDSIVLIEIQINLSELSLNLQIKNQKNQELISQKFSAYIYKIFNYLDYV